MVNFFSHLQVLEVALRTLLGPFFYTLREQGLAGAFENPDFPEALVLDFSLENEAFQGRRSNEILFHYYI